MDLRGRAIALYGRFSPGGRDRLEREIAARGGLVARDLTRRSDTLVVGGLATILVDSGALGARLEAARERGVPALGERAFADALAGEPDRTPATLALSTALAGAPLTREDAEVLAAFDLISIEGDSCRFGDAQLIRTAAELVGGGRSLGETVRILQRSRDSSPRGRHRIVLTSSGEAALQWPDGRTTLDGQGVLALDGDQASLEDLFEAYDLCARADRKDPIAPYNHGNIRLTQGANDKAILAYQQALARDAKFVEARYNLAQALEAAGKANGAAMELSRVLDADPGYSDAVFNLAQLRMKAGEMVAARKLYERYLALGPPEDWAQTARRAIQYCAAQTSA